MPTEREVKDRLRTSILMNIPPGTIVLWPDDKAVPLGWFECDGNNGTPNLSGETPTHCIYIQKYLAKVVIP